MEHLIVCGDPELGDEYLCQELVAGRDIVSPIVRVLWILRWPDQRAIVWPDIASEVAPIRAGEVCRLQLLREPSPEDLMDRTQAEARRAAIRRALAEARSAGERLILRRQACGVFLATRRIVRIREDQITLYQRSCICLTM